MKTILYIDEFIENNKLNQELIDLLNIYVKNKGSVDTELYLHSEKLNMCDTKLNIFLQKNKVSAFNFKIFKLPKIYETSQKNLKHFLKSNDVRYCSNSKNCEEYRHKINFESLTFTIPSFKTSYKQKPLSALKKSIKEDLKKQVFAKPTNVFIFKLGDFITVSGIYNSDIEALQAIPEVVNQYHDVLKKPDSTQHYEYYRNISKEDLEVATYNNFLNKYINVL